MSGFCRTKVSIPIFVLVFTSYAVLGGQFLTRYNGNGTLYAQNAQCEEIASGLHLTELTCVTMVRWPVFGYVKHITDKDKASTCWRCGPDVVGVPDNFVENRVSSAVWMPDADACPETHVFNTMLSGNVIPKSVDSTILTVMCLSGKELPGSKSTVYKASCTDGVWNDTRSCGIQSCDDALYRGMPSGVYKMYPDDALTEMEVYCDFEYDSGAAFTVIQQRVDDTVDFNRNWTDYVHGFGNHKGNFWVGLENVHIMTNLNDFEVHIQLRSTSKPADHYGQYHVFCVGNSSSNYRLKASNFLDGSPSVRNGFYGINLTPFSTWDNDNDGNDNYNCALARDGGWWFNSGCSRSNLNGIYTTGPVSGRRGVWWQSFTGDNESATYARMMLKIRGPSSGGC